MPTIEEVRGSETPEEMEARIRVSAYTGFGLYKPLEKRIRQIMNNIASNQELYGIDPSILKIEKGDRSDGGS